MNFETPDEAKKTMEALDGAMLGSKKLFVGRAQEKAEGRSFENMKIRLEQGTRNCTKKLKYR